MTDRSAERATMVERQIAARGIQDGRVLEAMRRVPREAFVPDHLAEFAYQDGPLPIAAGQTISQPFIVALMAEILQVPPAGRVLEVGAGSGYAAAVLAELADEVFTVERHRELADGARERLEHSGYDNVRVLHGDGTRGWAEHAPYDGIVVAAGAPVVPDSLRRQLKPGGRLVIPVGTTPREQQLRVVTRVDEQSWTEAAFDAVRFVPLVGEEGWEDDDPGPGARHPGTTSGIAGSEVAVAPVPREVPLPELMRAAAEPFTTPEDADLEPLLDRIANARVVLLGEATHGTSEFYRLRARLTRELVRRRGFRIIAVEADWPDAARIDRWVRPRPDGDGGAGWRAFARFPTWMWRNREVRELVDWLAAHNRSVAPQERAGFYGLDLYSLGASIGAVLDYLDEVDPEAASEARERYGCLEPWQQDPAVYGRIAVSGRMQPCEQDVVRTLRGLLERRLEYVAADGERFLDAEQNARLVAAAERYYRIMYYGGRESWNLRDQHMFDTLGRLLEHHGPGAKAVVWEHNSHVGDAAATEMGARGELNVGMLTREAFGDGAYIVGFGTDHGTVAAASDWDGPMEIKQVRPAHPDSYEHVGHETGLDAFLLPLRHPLKAAVRARLAEPRLERAIGVIYRPETELASHYFQAVLPHQFDEWVFFDRTTAVTPLEAAELAGVPETYPFGV